MPTTDKSTRWVFTAFEGAWQFFDADKPPEFVAEGGWQTEVCPKSQRHHYQGYLRTKTQVRMSFLKSKFPGVHLEAARDWYAAKNYTRKDVTAVPGTRVQWAIADNSASLTMTDTLMMVAENAVDYDLMTKCRQQDAKAEEVMRTTRVAMVMKPLKEMVKEEYWYAVKKILRADPQLAQRFACPDVERMWKGTREVWLEKISEDRQTDIVQEKSVTPV